MSDRPRYTMRQSAYKPSPTGMGSSFAYAMILDTWYGYREVWRIELGTGGGGEQHSMRIVNAAAVEKLAELEAEHEAWVAAT